MEEDFYHNLTRAGKDSQVDLYFRDLQRPEGFPILKNKYISTRFYFNLN